MPHALRHEPPTCSRCLVPLTMPSSHTVGLAGVRDGVAVGRAPGSDTPGGNGLDRDAISAPTPAHATNTAIHTITFSALGTDASLSRARSAGAEAGRERPQRQPEADERRGREDHPGLRPPLPTPVPPRDLAGH